MDLEALERKYAADAAVLKDKIKSSEKKIAELSKVLGVDLKIELSELESLKEESKKSLDKITKELESLISDYEAVDEESKEVEE